MKKRLRMPLAVLFAAGAICMIALSRPGWDWGPSSEVQEPVPNVDFSYMTITTRPVKTTESGGTAKVQVKARERCALGYATCDKPRKRTVEAVCLGSRTTVVIDEKDWPAFQRIPGEDLPGVEGLPRDMNLCAPPRS
jgi:hypothetical protein